MEKITHNYTHSNCQLCIGTQSVQIKTIMGQTLQQLVSSQPSSDHHHGMTNTNLKGDITSLIYWWYVPRKMQKKYEYPASLAIKLRIQTERCRKKQG